MKEESWTYASKGTEPTLVTKLEVLSLDLAKHLDWLTRFMMAAIECSEVSNAEVFPPTPGMTEWTLVEHFSTADQMSAWLQSPQHQALINELQPYLDRSEVDLSESIGATEAIGGSTSLAIVTQVKKGQEEAYLAYEKKYQSAQARASGFRGAYVQPPTRDSTSNWVTILRFDSPKAMERWLASAKRKELLAQAEPFVRSTDFHPVTTSFPGWFSTEVRAVGEGPPNWKTALLILLGLYPSVMLVIKYILPLMHGMHPAVSNFIGNILTVAFTTWVTMPIFIKLYKSWLFPTEHTSNWVHIGSIFSLFLFFAIEIALFWGIF